MSQAHDNLFLAELPDDVTTYPRGLYDCFPSFKPSQGVIHSGYRVLARRIEGDIPTGLRVLLIDGFQGIDWQKFRLGLDRALIEIGIEAVWLNLADCLAEEDEIYRQIAPFLGDDDPLFGTHYPIGPEFFFNAKRLAEFRILASTARGKKAGNLTIFYGMGAGLLELWDQLWYLDIPKDLIQSLARKGTVNNIGETAPTSFEHFYKRSYFVEWPALNRLKKRLLPDLDLFVDLQNPKKPTAISGRDFRSALRELSETPFRVRPWFSPGPWGGKFMQGQMGLDPKQPNFAWSFEIIVPENGIILEQDGRKLECSFDCLLYQENRRILGLNAAKQFKDEWPIRLDYLDTIDGGNLSVQVHPRPDYIRQNFGETYTQDESYYIVVAKPGARVYIGLTESCDPEDFKKVLLESEKTGSKVDIDQFVNSEPSKPGDLFLIPNGTVHCSGQDNLVLEISATPYIFTFKLYDYLRRDLDGNLRPINIEHGFNNIRFERRKNFIRKNLLAKPRLIDEGNGWQEYVLDDSPYTCYNIHRVEFDRIYETQTGDRALAINLVDGSQIELTAENGRKTSLSHLESIIVPAAAGKIKAINKGNHPCELILVYIRPGIGISEPLNDSAD